MKRTNNCSCFLEMLVKLSSPYQSTVYKNFGKTINLEVWCKSQRYLSSKSRMGAADELAGVLPQRV